MPKVPKCPRIPRCSPQLFVPSCVEAPHVLEVPHVPEMPQYYEVPNTPTRSVHVQGFAVSSVIWVTGLFTNFWSWVKENNVNMVVNNSNLWNNPPRDSDCGYEHLFYDEDRWHTEQGKASAIPRPPDSSFMTAVSTLGFFPTQCETLH